MKLPIFDSLMNKEMTRKEFILHILTIMVFVTGISRIKHLLSDENINQTFKGLNGYGK